MDFIDGDKFENLSDIIYSERINEDLEKYSGNELPIVYCDSDKIDELFDKNINTKFILVTHNSDKQIRLKDILKKPSNISFWFANNLIDNYENVFNIPTGLERDRWFPQLRKKDVISELNYSKKEFTNLAFMCHNTNRTWDFDRKNLYKQFSNKTWVTKKVGQNGYNFYSYAKDIYHHKFHFCPVGNQEGYNDGDNASGSHRFWEILYLNSIPIVLNKPGNRKYDDLPICFVDNWSDVSEGFLNKEFDKITNKISMNEYNLDSLKFKYWEQKIKKFK